ncbi:MAG: group III truncated hemoglobin [Chitinophagaceae bacterium]|nr:group III truncated hemoglobin [Chitinophagaceae bacterium]MCW5929038.1 group III truncated hemoglobin [Chitinophagaceae bacterium]
MKPDIVNRRDIEKIVHLFYEKVKVDDLIGFFFSDVVQVNWEQHLPIMCAFWENVLFYTGDYEGDPLTTHRGLYNKFKTTPEHFQRWLFLFFQSVDELYEGSNAQKMKDHATGISGVMQDKIKGSD